MLDYLKRKEKVLTGELYIATDPELAAMRRRARLLMKKFSKHLPRASQKQLLRNHVAPEIIRKR